MSVALYADYISDLRALLSERDQTPERFQTFDVRLELAAAGGLVVYETKRRKGLTDSLYYGRSAETATNRQISQTVAFSAIDRFFALGQFVALSGEVAVPSEDGRQRPIDAGYPHCAVNFSYRKKGQPVARSMLMVFIGFNDEADALRYVEASGRTHEFVRKRPHQQPKSFEWT